MKNALNQHLAEIQTGICDNCGTLGKVAILNVECGGHPEPKFCGSCLADILNSFGEGWIKE